jgi:hypothetical protein
MLIYSGKARRLLLEIAASGEELVESLQTGECGVVDGGE